MKRSEYNRKAKALASLKAAIERRGKSDEADAIPHHSAILDAALDATGLREAWEANALEGRQALDLLHAVRLEGRRLFRAWAEELLADIAPDSTKALLGGVKAKVGAFFGRMAKGVRELFAAGVLALAGPDPSVLDDPTVQEALAVEVDRQHEYLTKFADEIVRENKPLDGTFAARAEQYGSSAWAGPQMVVRETARKRRVFDLERRTHYGADQPCDTCQAEVDKGWKPIGTLRAIGDSECRCQCHCGFSYAKGADGKPHIAGRGPLHPQVFGRTG